MIVAINEHDSRGNEEDTKAAILQIQNGLALTRKNLVTGRRVRNNTTIKQILMRLRRSNGAPTINVSRLRPPRTRKDEETSATLTAFKDADPFVGIRARPSNEHNNQLKSGYGRGLT